MKTGRENGARGRGKAEGGGREGEWEWVVERKKEMKEI